MKIIFDNEEEKQELIHYVCPSVLSRHLKDIGMEVVMNVGKIVDWKWR